MVEYEAEFEAGRYMSSRRLAVAEASTDFVDPTYTD